jgi:hypothetical protein
MGKVIRQARMEMLTYHATNVFLLARLLFRNKLLEAIFQGKLSVKAGLEKGFIT